MLLGNQVELWETTLAATKVGAVLVPATTLLTEKDLRDRVERAGAGAVIARADVGRVLDCQHRPHVTNVGRDHWQAARHRLDHRQRHLLGVGG